MKFLEVIEKAGALLQRKGRITYRALQREFDLDDEALEDLKNELIDAEQAARDENGKVLVWTGASPVQSSEFKVQSSQAVNQQSETSNTAPPSQDSALRTQHSPAERRQLTVMFCDLVGSTALSTQLDPEDLREVVRQYQQTCAAVIQRHDGHIAQYLGDGLLVYFGYPAAHEDDARRAVRAGVEIIQALRSRVLSPLVGEGQGEGGKSETVLTPHPNLPPQGGKEKTLQVRIGIHTGLVVVGDIGTSGRTEQLALGETPNLAARIQGLAEPNTVLISAATQRLIEGQFECQPFGSHMLKGIDTPIAVYRVQSERQSVSPLAGKATLTPLVGREQEVGLLLDRWEQVKEGRGQVVLLSGEPGIGKSRLAHTLREHVTAEGSFLFETRCSSYHQHSALYPLIDVLQRTLLFARQDSDEEKVAKLERVLALYEMTDTLPLFTALLSLATPSQYPPLNYTPQKQKELTFQALLQLLATQAERQATVSVWEDLHWADPSSLEFLSLLIEQIPTTKLLLVLTFRPEFIPPWKPRSHISQLVLNRLGKKQVEAMIEKMASDHALSVDVIEQIRVKTDGVPLFVEELTKSVIENVGAHGRASLQTLAIPATLQEALLARLDRLSDARQVAQLGATLGREFSYELIQAVAPLSEVDLHAALTKLVEAEILYQRGVGEQARYFFKHALIQDTAYQSLLKSTRRQYHQQIAQVLEEKFPETKEHQPELLAHHYTEAGLIGQAIPYWQLAGQQALARSAHIEAGNYLTKGLTLLKTMPNTPTGAQYELTLQVDLGNVLIATKGFAAPEVKEVYTRALQLCQRVGETPELVPVLEGLSAFYTISGEILIGRQVAEQILSIAQRLQDATLFLAAYHELGFTWLYSGAFSSALPLFEKGVTLYDPKHHHALALHYVGHDPGMCLLSNEAFAQWMLGYPDRAAKTMQQALRLSRDLTHPISLAHAFGFASMFHQFQREKKQALTYAKDLVVLSTDQGFTFTGAWGAIMHGWAIAMQGRGEEGVSQIEAGLVAWRATGAELFRPYFLALLAEANGRIGRVERGLTVSSEALVTVNKTEERIWEAELYRLKGELTLQLGTRGLGLETSSPYAQVSGLEPQVRQEPMDEAEECFLKALEVSRKQQAKSLELRASTSLARLWQQQGKKAEAHKLLSEIYNWFTEGFDTKDLQEAKALLEELTER